MAADAFIRRTIAPAHRRNRAHTSAHRLAGGTAGDSSRGVAVDRGHVLSAGYSRCSEVRAFVDVCVFYCIYILYTEEMVIILVV